MSWLTFFFAAAVFYEGLVQNDNDIEIQRSDVNSPLYSVKTFEALNLKPELLKGVYCMGFNKPSRIQVGTYLVLIARKKKSIF